MDSRAKEVLRIGDGLFGRKRTVDSLWQEIALNFYTERADFTERRNDGEEYADHAFASYPFLARRELGNLMSANLRPQSAKWFSTHVDDLEIDDESEERRFLEYMRDIQWRAMYDNGTGFIRATKQADHDYAAFGNAVIRGTPNFNNDGLLFRNFHLRDCVWTENASGEIDCLYRKWNPTARQLKETFGEDRVSKDVKKACEKEPEKTFECRHVVMPQRMYRYETKSGREFDFVSMFVECEAETVLEEVGKNHFEYVVPRWQTVSGSVFGRSMATEIALPDSRTMQVVMRTLREAGEKFVDPPMIAIADAIRGDIPLYPGGITIADMEYDERLGEVLRPVTQDRGGMPIGFEIAAALREDINSAFFLDKIQLPEPQVRDMTAYEVRRRIEEHVRAAAPLFEPIEQDYNAPLCDLAFQILMDGGAFPLEKMPDSLQGRDIRFTFRSPLSDMAEQAESQIFLEGMSTILPAAAQIDPAQIENVDITESTRDALRAIGWKAEWFKKPEAVAAKRQELAEMAKAQQALGAAGEASAVAEQAGKAGQAINAAVNQ